MPGAGAARGNSTARARAATARARAVDRTVDDWAVTIRSAGRLFAIGRGWDRPAAVGDVVHGRLVEDRVAQPAGDQTTDGLVVGRTVAVVRRDAGNCRHVLEVVAIARQIEQDAPGAGY